jgi:hypothetical protein
MLKKDATEKGIATTYIRCGECAYFRVKRPNFEVKCSESGVLSRAIAPTCFVPNFNTLKRGGVQTVSVLNLLAGNMSVQQVRTLAALFNRESRLRKVGLFLFQKVYCWVSDPKYLSNYYSAYVLGVGVLDSEVVLLGSFSNSQKPILAHVLREHVLDDKTFAIKKDQLIKKQQIYDPKIKRNLKQKGLAKEKDYEPPTLDMSIEELEAAASKLAGMGLKKKGSRQKKRTTYVTRIQTKD